MKRGGGEEDEGDGGRDLRGPEDADGLHESRKISFFS